MGDQEPAWFMAKKYEPLVPVVLAEKPWEKAAFSVAGLKARLKNAVIVGQAT